MEGIIRIDNQIVERFGNTGVKIGSIRLFEKQHRTILNFDKIPYVFTGSRRTDAILMQRLISGTIHIDDFDIIYPL
jgi:hypothetical protein